MSLSRLRRRWLGRRDTAPHGPSRGRDIRSGVSIKTYRPSLGSAPLNQSV